MPKTALFQTTRMMLIKDYIKKEENKDKTINDFIIPGMSLVMNYTHTKNYMSEEATINVTVVSVGINRNCCGCSYDITDSDSDSDYDTTTELKNTHSLTCVLKTDDPIFVCVYGADLARGITLSNTDLIPIVSGYVDEILDSYTDYHPVIIRNRIF